MNKSTTLQGGILEKKKKSITLREAADAYRNFGIVPPDYPALFSQEVMDNMKIASAVIERLVETPEGEIIADKWRDDKITFSQFCDEIAQLWKKELAENKNNS
jgi:hypothetical protein